MGVSMFVAGDLLKPKFITLTRHFHYLTHRCKLTNRRVRPRDRYVLLGYVTVGKVSDPIYLCALLHVSGAVLYINAEKVELA